MGIGTQKRDIFSILYLDISFLPANCKRVFRYKSSIVIKYGCNKYFIICIFWVYNEGISGLPIFEDFFWDL